MSVSYRDIEGRFAETGLVVRGGFPVTAEDPVDGTTIVMLGNVGRGMWRFFSSQRPDSQDPLDTWTKSVVGPRAEALGARPIFPNDKPYRPFQQWAARAEAVFSSPLGILIHPQFGLWHAYRAALVFPGVVGGLPEPQHTAHPCDACVEKPCLTTCPVNAFDGEGYDVPACVSQLETESGTACHTKGCLARLACPVGMEHQSPIEQRAFHAAAFYRSQSGNS